MCPPTLQGWAYSCGLNIKVFNSNNLLLIGLKDCTMCFLFNTGFILLIQTDMCKQQFELDSFLTDQRIITKLYTVYTIPELYCCPRRNHHRASIIGSIIAIFCAFKPLPALAHIYRWRLSLRCKFKIFQPIYFPARLQPQLMRLDDETLRVSCAACVFWRGWK